VSRLYDGGVMLIVEGCAPEIDESDLGVLEDLGPRLAVGDGLLGVRAVVEQHILRLQICVSDPAKREELFFTA